MKITEKSYAWAYTLDTRTTTTRLILHHAAAVKCTADDIHRWHLSNGWTGFGYHFLVSKDGTVTRGRPINTVGAHTYGYNKDSIAICFEGNFEIESMPAAQVQAGQELVQYIRSAYPTITEVKRHKDYDATACPGRNFPFDGIVVREHRKHRSRNPYSRHNRSWQHRYNRLWREVLYRCGYPKLGYSQELDC